MAVPAIFPLRARATAGLVALKITMPIALDTMDDRTAGAYAGFTTSAVVVGRDGTVIGFRNHADAHAVRRILDDALGEKPTPTTGPS